MMMMIMLMMVIVMGTRKTVLSTCLLRVIEIGQTGSKKMCTEYSWMIRENGLQGVWPGQSKESVSLLAVGVYGVLVLVPSLCTFCTVSMQSLHTEHVP